MRTSSRKTTAAELRHIIGIKVPEWAEILDRSPHSVHDLESGRLKLSAAMAARMNYETGISIKWLMDGDPTAPPITPDGRAYTKKIYENARARKKHFATVRDSDVKKTVLDVFRSSCAILVNANRKRNFHLAVYRTAKALAELRDEFGEAKDFNTIKKAEDYVRDASRWRPVDVYEPPPEHLREGLRKMEHLTARDYPTSKPKSKRPSKKRRR